MSNTSTGEKYSEMCLGRFLLTAQIYVLPDIYVVTKYLSQI